MTTIEKDVIEILNKDYNNNVTSETLLKEIYGPDKLGIVELELAIFKKFSVDIDTFRDDINTVDDLCKLVEYMVSKNKKHVVAKKEKTKKQKVSYEQFVESAKQILKKSVNNLDTDKISLTSNLMHDFGMDSLDYTEMLFGLEKLYNFHIDDKLFQKTKHLNFGEICRLAYASLNASETKKAISNVYKKTNVR